MLLADTPSRALRDRLAAPEAERDQIEAAIADVAPAVVEFHPNAAKANREKMRNLKSASPHQTGQAGGGERSDSGDC